MTYAGKSIFNYGDVSTCSFHATKLFQTAEGGAMFCNDDELYHQLYYSHNFGHDGPLKFHGLGVNGKMSELQAAMGLAVFPHVSHIFSERKKVVEFYLNNIDFSKCTAIKIRENTNWNYSYFPLVFETEEALLQVEEALNIKDVFPRRYFYPSLNTISYINGKKMPVSESIASRILCLPLYVGLTEEELITITSAINEQ